MKNDIEYRLGIMLEAARFQRSAELARSVRNRDAIANIERTIAGLNRKMKEFA
jgi:hypothetical protein